MLDLRFGCLLAPALGLALLGCSEAPDGTSPDLPIDPLTRADAAVSTADSGQPGPSQGGPVGPSQGGPVGSSTPDASIAVEAGPKPDAATGDAAQPRVDAGGSPDAGDSGTDSGVVTTTRPKPKCVKKDSQVLVIGDSFINWISHAFPEQIKTASKQNWRMLAVGGTAMGSGGIGRIPDQFDQAIKADPDAHTVLMDGGGNDVLVPDLFLDALGACRDTGSSKNPNCQMIVKLALDAADALLKRAAAAGIRDVVYFFYPHIPEARLIGGPHPNEILDYSIPMVKSFCDGAEARTEGKLRCHFIDMIPVFEGHIPGVNGLMAGSEADWFNEDIHPNPKGSQGMVDKVWQVMTERCIGQKDKDCCEN